MRFSLLIALSLLMACELTLKTPSFADEELVPGAAEVPVKSLDIATGFYSTEGSDYFGDRVILAYRGSGLSGLSLFTDTNNAYAMMKAGCIEEGTRLILEGTWRFATKSSRGTIRLEVAPAEAAQSLCAGEAPKVGPITLTGALGQNSDELSKDLTLTREAALIPPPKEFLVIAHRGGCRTIDACGAAENSLEVIRLAEPLGSNVIEIDIQFTQDEVPILYHDASFSDRLTQGLFCVGPVADFPLAHVKELCKLTNGEEIPTLREALETVIYDTTLKGVWLDIKATEALGAVVELADEMKQVAIDAGRTVHFMHGLWNEDLVAEWDKLDLEQTNCLVELDPKIVGKAGCDIWAPRWTLGPIPEAVAQMQATQRKVAFWTVDEQGFVDLLLNESTPDGMLTNRPGLVYYRSQARLLELAEAAEGTEAGTEGEEGTE